LKLDKNTKNQPLIISKINLDCPNPIANNLNNKNLMIMNNGHNNNKASEEIEKTGKEFEENKNEKDAVQANNYFIKKLNQERLVNMVKNEIPIANFEERLDKMLSKDS